MDNRPYIPTKVQLPEIGRLVQVQFDNQEEGIGMYCIGFGGAHMWLTAKKNEIRFTDHAYDYLYVSGWRLPLNTN